MKLIDPFWRLNACFIKLNDWCTKSLEQLLKLNLLICKLKYTFKCAYNFARNWMIWKSIWMELILNWLGKPIFKRVKSVKVLFRAFPLCAPPQSKIHPIGVIFTLFGVIFTHLGIIFTCFESDFHSVRVFLMLFTLLKSNHFTLFTLTLKEPCYFDHLTAGGWRILPHLKILETDRWNIKCVVLVDSYDPPESIGTNKIQNIPCMTSQWRHVKKHENHQKSPKSWFFAIFFKQKLHFLAMMCVKVCLHMFLLKINQINKIKHSGNVSWKTKKTKNTICV